MVYSTNPPEVAVGGARISVSITEVGQEWDVTALFARRPPTVPIDGADVKMAAYDTTGAEMAMLHRPAELLTEAGGSLSTTVNATFRFAGAKPPGKVVVQWAGESAVFHVFKTL